MRDIFRSGCPIATTLDIIGDKWSLLIVRDMLFQGKKAFKEFSASPEKIAPGILSSRLKWLEDNGLISKRKLADNQKENVYLLTEKGIGLAPVMTEIVLWSDQNLRFQNPEMYAISEAGFDQEKTIITAMIQANYRKMVAELIS